MHSYAINVPVADRNFVLQYSVWVLGLLQLHHIAKVNYNWSTDNQKLRQR